MKFSILLDGIEYKLLNKRYAVSRCGKVLRKFEPFAPYQRPDGYLSLGRQGLLHRAVAKLWLEPRDGAKHIHHINGDKTDNRADNLEFVTPKEHFGDRHLGQFGHYIRTPETREKIRAARLGSVTSEETKAKQRAALLGRKRQYFPRAQHSDESKAIRSLNHPRNTECKVFGVVYRSFLEASRATGIKKGTIRKRCLSKNFPDYEITN